jgi:hypothetical protein
MITRRRERDGAEQALRGCLARRREGDEKR